MALDVDGYLTREGQLDDELDEDDDFLSAKEITVMRVHNRSISYCSHTVIL